MEIAWRYSSGELERRSPELTRVSFVEVTPILVPVEAGGALVLCTPFNRIIALDPDTGEERWVFDPDVPAFGNIPSAKPSTGKLQLFPNCRGVTYWSDDRAQSFSPCKHRIFFATHDLRLMALDANTSAGCSAFGDDGVVNIKSLVAAHPLTQDPGDVTISSPPAVVNDVIVTGSRILDREEAASGEVRAFDARTGDAVWHFDPIPRAPEDPADGEWTKAAARSTGGANVWSMMSVDEERDLIDLPP